MTALDPTGVLASEWSYGFPDGEPEEGKPGPLPRRTPLATISPALLAEIDEPIPYLPVSPDTTTLRFSHPAPTNTPTDAVTTPNPVSVGGALPSLVELDRSEAAEYLAYWSERALSTLDPDSLLAGHLLEAITAYRQAVQS